MALYDVMKKQADKTLQIVFKEVFSKGEKFDYADGAIVGLFENMITHSDSISILIKSNHPGSLDSILRTLFENYVYLRFILQDDSNRRAKSYFYSSKVDEYLLVELFKENSKAGESIRAFFGPKLEGILTEYEKRGIKKETIEQRYLKELGMKWLKQKWYNLYPELELSSFKKLCIHCGKEADYHLVYSTLSREVHAKDALYKLELRENFVGIKLTEDNDTTLHEILVKAFLLESIREVLTYYNLKKQLKEFNSLVAWNVRISKRQLRL